MNLWTAALIALWIVVLFNLLLTYSLIRRIAAQGGSGSPPPVGGLRSGESAPAFAAQTPDGATLSLPDLGEPAPLVLAFFSPTCAACENHLPDFTDFIKRAEKSGVRAVAVLDGDADASAKLRAGLPAQLPALLAPRGANPFLDDYQVTAYPSYTVVRTDGTVDGTYGMVRQLDDRLKELV